MSKSELVLKPKVHSIVTQGGVLIQLTYDLVSHRLLSRHVPYRPCDYSPGVQSWPRRLAFGDRRVLGQWFARTMKIERLGQIELQTTKTGRYIHVYTVHDRYLLDLAQFWKQVARQLVRQNARGTELALSAMPGLRRSPTPELGRPGGA